MATPAEQLEAAKTAYHNLMIGKSVRVAVDMNGERVEYTAANAGKLKAYIDELEIQIAGTNRGRGPMTAFF